MRHDSFRTSWFVNSTEYRLSVCLSVRPSVLTERLWFLFFHTKIRGTSFFCFFWHVHHGCVYNSRNSVIFMSILSLYVSWVESLPRLIALNLCLLKTLVPIWNRKINIFTECPSVCPSVCAKQERFYFIFFHTKIRGTCQTGRLSFLFFSHKN